MLNADEHKKILAQIKELEKNSINYFDVEKEFFLIDSNNLSQIRPKLYGYSIQRNGIYEDDNLTEDAAKNLDGRGCYVYVDVKDGQITIKQDLNGCWGIYLFRQGDYFALSNSFFRLLDHIKFKYPLTVNRDYCHHLLLEGFCSDAYSETAVNEVQLIERNAIIQIDVANKNLDFEFIDYRENTVPLDSEEGIATLDSWIEFWGSVLRGVAKNTKFIQADLSGGFDSRLAFIVALHSGINLNDMQIYSIIGSLHTYKEDYEIASQIAEHYGFKLNQTLPENPSLNLSFSDAWNKHVYNLQTIRSIPTFSSQKPINKCYRLTGYGGEMIRDYWLRFNLEKWHQGKIDMAKLYQRPLSDELANSMETIIKSAFNKIRNKYKIEDQNSSYILLHLYNEGQGRHHFGKTTLYNYFENKISISPIIDPLLLTLKLNTSECLDYKLLMALLFARYEPDLLKFPFDSGQSIAPETIEYAKKINERFPHRIKDVAEATRGGVFYLQSRDLQAEKILTLSKNNPPIPNPVTCLKAIFESSRTFGLFSAYFNEELYHYAAQYYDTKIFGRYRYMISVVGVTKVLEDVEISQRNYPLYRGMQRFIEQDFCLIHRNDAQIIIDKFKEFFTARILIQLDKEMNAENLRIISFSDDGAKLLKPGYWQNRGICHAVDSYVGSLEIVAKVAVEGEAIVRLSGAAKFYIDYTKFIVNDKIIFDKLTQTRYDKPYVYKKEVKAGEEIKIQVEWLPHRSDT